MKGISYLTDEIGKKKAIVIDVDLLKDRDSLLEILEDIEDEISVELRKNEASLDWDTVRNKIVSED